MTDTPDPASTAADAHAGTDSAAGTAQVAPAVAALPPRRGIVWASLSSPFAMGFLLTLGGLAAIVLGLATASLSTILIYIAFALFAALGLDPVVRWLEKHGVKRGTGIAIVYSAFAVILVLVLWIVVPTVVRQIAQFFSDLPGIFADFKESPLYGWLTGVMGDPIETALNEVQKFITNPANVAAVGGGVLQIGVTIATTISGLIIVLVLSLYFLASLPSMKVSFARLTPARSRAKVTSLTNEITESIGGYLMGMVILAFCNAMFSLVLHLVLGLPFAALMTVVAFSITLIPLVGTVLYWGIATALALLSDPLAALIFAIAYLIYMQIEAYVLTPRVMNRAVEVPGALVVIGALVGGTLLGLLGALIAIPVTASLLLILKQVFIPRQDAKV